MSTIIPTQAAVLRARVLTKEITRLWYGNGTVLNDGALQLLVPSDAWKNLYSLSTPVAPEPKARLALFKTSAENVLGYIQTALDSGARLDDTGLVNYVRIADLLLSGALKGQLRLVRSDPDLGRLVKEAKNLGLLADVRLEFEGVWGC